MKCFEKWVITIATAGPLSPVLTFGYSLRNVLGQELVRTKKIWFSNSKASTKSYLISVILYNSLLKVAGDCYTFSRSPLVPLSSENLSVCSNVWHFLHWDLSAWICESHHTCSICWGLNNETNVKFIKKIKYANTFPHGVIGINSSA